MTRLFSVFVLCFAFTSVFHAQTTSASLRGRVTDPTKAVIADGRVTAISTGTNLRYETTTSSSGEYYLSNLPPSPYRIEVEKSGFTRLIKPDVVVHVQDVLEINFEMKVGSTSESITVEGGAPLANAESATVSTVIDRTFVEYIPLNGRSFQTLIMLTPGVVVTATNFADQGQFSVNGQRADANYFTVDGASANFGVTGYFPLGQTAGGALPALSLSGGTNSLVSVDAMQEFRVQTSSFAPEFGRTPGAQISIATRSGTNKFHGTLFEYFRNDVLDAKDWFANFNHLAKPEERQNDFGGVFGGPLLKDKTFFFFSYEGLRLRQPLTEQSVVPDAASRLAPTPASMIPFLNAYPMPNGAALGPGLAQFNASFSNPSSLDAYSIRVDQLISSRLTLFGRYNYSPSSLDQRAAPFPSPALSTTQAISSAVHTFTVGITQLIKPAISNELRANYSNQRLGTKFAVDGFGGAVPLPDSLLFPAGFSSTDSGFLFLINGVGEYGQGKTATDEQRQVNLIDNLSLSKSGHEMKFGVDYRWLAPFSSPFTYRQFVDFSGVACPAPSQSCAGYALSGTVPGAVTTASFAQPGVFEPSALLSQNFSLFGQDTWKITPRLTLTYGLRWDINPPPKGKNSANQLFTVTGLDNPPTIALAPPGTPLYETTYGNVAPRFGIAYQIADRPNWGTLLRAGFGIFYDLGQGWLGGASAFFPHSATRSLTLAQFPLTTTDASPPPISTSPPVNTMLVADPHLKLPRTYQWNLALEQSIGSSQVVSLSYVGALGRDLLRVSDFFHVNPDFLVIELTDNSATSDYHALQAKYQRRLSRGLQALASYSWSHSIDIASSDTAAGSLSTPATIAGPQVDRGNSDFDIRHSFTAGVNYDFPSPGPQQVVKALLQGWSLHTFVLARSAPPVNIVGATAFAAGVALAPRPNVTPGIPLYLYGSSYPGGKIINNTPGTVPGGCPPNGLPSVGPFCAPPSGTQGNFPRNVLRGFGAAQWDFGVRRSFPIREAWRLEFRGEFFNILNHPNFGNPVNNLSSPLFGQSTQTLANSLGSGGANGGFNPLYQIGGARSIQLALKLQF